MGEMGRVVSARPREHPIPGGEGCVPFCCLSAAVGGAVAAHHIGGTVAEQMLDIEFAGVVGDRPGGEGMPEAMGMDPRDARSFAQPPQELLEPVGPEPHARLEPPVAGGQEERPRSRSPVGKIGGESGSAAIGEGDDPVLAALPLPHQQPPLPQRAVRQVQVGRFGTADTGIQQRQEDRPIAAAAHRRGVAAGQQPSDLLGDQGRHDRLGQADVAEAAEGVVGGVPGSAQPGAETTHLAEVTVAGGGPVVGEASEVSDHVIGPEPVGVQRGPVLLKAAGEAGQRLTVGGDRAGRLALDGTAGEVSVDEGREEQVAGRSGVHGLSMDALLAAAVKS